MKKVLIVFIHLFYWLALGLFFLFVFAMLNEISNKSIQKLEFIRFVSVIFIIPGLISFYTTYFWSFDHFLKRNKYIFFTGISLLVAYVSTVTGGFLGPLYKNYWNYVTAEKSLNLLIEASFFSFITLCHALVAVIIKGFITWINELKLKAELAEKNKEMELALIKAQSNPHFLFNTIQNIDVLIHKYPDKASAYLIKLSNMMRFTLYDVQDERIPITQEIDYIKEYIELQALRSHNPNYIKFELSGKLKNKYIAPKIFIPFVENAFKYAANKKMDEAIQIMIKVEQQHVHFECYNQFDPDINVPGSYRGLGNKLITKRINLLYPNNHTFHQWKKENTYVVKLILPLYEN